jgi:hypothetical protein
MRVLKKGVVKECIEFIYDITINDDNIEEYLSADDAEMLYMKAEVRLEYDLVVWIFLPEYIYSLNCENPDTSTHWTTFYNPIQK